MKRTSRTLLFTLAIAGVTTLTLAAANKPKPGPLTGTWQCMAHGGPDGDLAFTLTLEQSDETVTGSVSSPIGSTELGDASFKKNRLEIHIDAGETKYLLTGTYKKGQLS